MFSEHLMGFVKASPRSWHCSLRHRGLLQFFFLCSAACSFAWQATAQGYLNQIGIPPFTTSQPVESGFVNLANGNLHLEFPLGSYPQRGTSRFVAELVYDSRIWGISSVPSVAWSPNSQGGWRFLTSADNGSFSSQSSSDGGHPPTITVAASWIDPNGTAHGFPAGFQPSPCVSSSSGGFAYDGSGYYMSLTYTCGVGLSYRVWAPDGSLVIAAVAGTHAPGDTNGNYFSKDANQNVVDTLGRTPVVYVANGANCSTSYCYNILNSTGQYSQIKVSTTTVSVNTAFGQAGVTEFSGSFTAISNIQLPDGKSYTFSYDSGTTAGHYGTLTSVTLPTGGQITYGTTKFQDSYGNKNLWITSRTPSGGGTWNYTPAVVSTCGTGQVGCQQTVTVTAPSNDNTVYTFTLNNGAWKSTVQHYTGAISAANLVSTVGQAWDFSQPCAPTPCTGATKIKLLTTTTTLPVPGSTSITNQTKITYVDTNTPNIASVKAWKFYVGTSPTFPATPDRETDFTYHAVFGNNITNRVTQKTIKDNTGAVVSQTNFSYDDSGSLSNTTPATGIPHHDDTNFSLSNTTRGDLTTIKRCTVLSGCSTNFLQSTMKYDTTGQLVSVTDQNSNVTSFSYADNFYNDATDAGSITNPPTGANPATNTNAYLTSVTPAIPAAGVSTYGYYFGTGKRASVKDGNNADSYAHFVDSLDRQTHSYGPTLPIAGSQNTARPWTLNVYAASETEVDTYTDINDPSATPSSSCSVCRQDRVLLDTVGRPIQAILVSDPDQQAMVDTVYDTSGRVQKTSHPYRNTNDPTYGFEVPTYDGLNRTIKITHPDATFSQTFYGAAVTSAIGGITTQNCASATYGLGYPTLFVDESLRKRQIWTDGFGRTIEGDEPNSSGTLNATSPSVCYLYDSLGNSLQVKNTSNAQTRTYAYDPVSRVTSVTTPEAGATSFFYTTSTGALCSGNLSAVCRRTDARSITATYTFDPLNRLTKTSYSDSTPIVQYVYDNATPPTGCTPPTLADSNPKGRKTAMCDGSGATSWAHDAGGRIVTEKRTIQGTSAVTQIISYSYNLDGSVNTTTYPSGKQVTYTVSNAQRYTGAQDPSSGGSKYAWTASYAAPGGLQSMITGQVTGFVGVTESHTYNNRLEYTSTKAAPPTGAPALDLTLAYSLTGGDNGSVTTITNNQDPGRTETLTYDPLSRILKAVSSNTTVGNVDCWGQTFGPDGNAADDAVANLTKINNGTQTQPPCPYGGLNGTVDANTNHMNTDSTFATDAAGNMTKDGKGTGYSYTFDAENHLIQATGMTGGPWCYIYDGNGLRVAKRSGGTGTSCTNGTFQKLYWRSLSGDSLAETDGSGSLTNTSYSEYVFFTGRRIASRVNVSSGASPNVSIFYYFADQLGSTRTIITGSGKKADGTAQTPALLCYDADFTPYGQEISHAERLQTTACPPSYKFTGYERDPETAYLTNDQGLDYAFARYYSSRLGRFLSTDPLVGSVGNLQSHNAYTYTVNDPLNLVDPSGMGNCPPQAPPSAICGPPSSVGSWDDQESLDLAAMTGVNGSGEIAIAEARYESIITTGWDPVLEIQYYGYEFTGVDRSSKLEQQKELAAIQLGEAKCAGQGPDAIAACILDAYNTLVPKAPEGKNSALVGGNYNFDYTQVVIQGDQINPANFGCVWGRCGAFDSLHFHSDGTFHVDTANVWFVPIGTVLHFGVDYIGGNTWWSSGIPRP